MPVIGFLGRYILNILIAIDQLCNALALGDPDETISHRCARAAYGSGWWRLGRLIEAVDPGHLARAKERAKGRGRPL